VEIFNLYTDKLYSIVKNRLIVLLISIFIAWVFLKVAFVYFLTWPLRLILIIAALYFLKSVNSHLKTKRIEKSKTMLEEGKAAPGVVVGVFEHYSVRGKSGAQWQSLIVKQDLNQSAQLEVSTDSKARSFLLSNSLMPWHHAWKLIDWQVAIPIDKNGDLGGIKVEHLHKQGAPIPTTRGKEIRIADKLRHLDLAIIGSIKPKLVAVYSVVFAIFTLGYFLISSDSVALTFFMGMIVLMGSVYLYYRPKYLAAIDEVARSGIEVPCEVKGIYVKSYSRSNYDEDNDVLSELKLIATPERQSLINNRIEIPEDFYFYSENILNKSISLNSEEDPYYIENILSEYGLFDKLKTQVLIKMSQRWPLTRYIFKV
jgi:Ca2+/Na+ antiporter